MHISRILLYNYNESCFFFGNAIVCTVVGVLSVCDVHVYMQVPVLPVFTPNHPLDLASLRGSSSNGAEAI